MKKNKIYLYIIFAAAIIFAACTIADDYLSVTKEFIEEGLATQLDKPKISVTENVNYVKINNTLQLNASGSGSGVTYLWNATDGQINLSGTPVSFRAPDATGDVIISCYAAKSGKKDSDKAYITIDVQEFSKLTTPTIIGNKTILTNSETLDLTAIGSEPGSTYNWSLTGLGGISSSTGDTITYTAPSSGTGSATIYCYATQTNYLDSDSSNFNLTISTLPQLPKPTVSNSGSGTVIINDTRILTVTNPVGGAVYNWSISLGSGNLSSATGISVTYTAPSIYQDVVVRCYGTLAGYSNSNNTDTFLYIKLGKLTTPVISGNNTVIINNNLTLSASGSESGSTYNWSVTGTGIINPTGSTVLFSSGTVENVTASCYASKTGYIDSDPVNHNISVTLPTLATPTISITIGSANMVIDGQITLQVDSPVSGATYNWSVFSGGGSLNFSTGNSVVYTAPSIVANPVIRCYGSKTGYNNSSNVDTNITVKLGSLVAPTISGHNNTPVGRSRSYTASSSDSGVTFNWTVTSGSINSTGTPVTFNPAGVGTVTITCWTTKTDYYNSPNTTKNVSVVDIASNEMILWLDASDLFTITKDGSDYVSQWRNKSPINLTFNDFDGTDDAKKPRYYTTGLFNGTSADKEVLRFDGVNDFLMSSSFSGLNYPRITATNPVVYTAMFVVFTSVRVQSSATWETLFASVYDTGYNRSNGIGFYNRKISGYCYGNRYGYDSANNPFNNTRYTVSYIFDGGASIENATAPDMYLKTKIWVNGSAQAVNTGNPYYITTGPVFRFIIGGISPSPSSSYNFNGDIAEILVYSSTTAPMSASDRQKIQNYLNAKWTVY